MPLTPAQKRGEGYQAYSQRLSDLGFEVSGIEGSFSSRQGQEARSQEAPLRLGVPGVGQAGGPQDAARATPRDLDLAVKNLKTPSLDPTGLPPSPEQNRDSKILGDTLAGLSLPDKSGRGGEDAVSSFMKSFQTTFGGGAPVSKTPEEIVSGARQQAGAGTAEQGYSDATANLRALENKLFTDADIIKEQPSAPGVTSAFINRKLVQLDSKNANALREARAGVQNATDRLQMANQQVSQLINLTQNSYQNSRSAYEFETNKAFQFLQMFQAQQNKEEAGYRAAITGFINVAKENPDALKNATLSDKAEWQSWELKAGLDLGYTEGVLRMVKQVSDFEYKGTVGDKDIGHFTVLYNQKTGEPKVVKIVGGIAGKDASNEIIQKIQTSNISPEQKNTQIITTLLKNPKLGQGTRTNLSTSLGVMNAVEDMSNARQISGFKGISPLNTLLDIEIPFTDIGLIPFREAARSKEGRENAGYIEAINLKTQQWASGAALTEKQTAQVARFTPTVNDTDQAVRDKLNNLYNFMLTQSQTYMQSEGISFNPVPVDLFELYNLIQKATPEQLQELKDQGLIK